jgi:DNA-binding LacI/PurR family transcriptional regulator
MSAQTPSSPPRPRPTMRHVAALAGVGIKTVSRVMNGEPNVSEATIKRVRDAVDRLDYELDVNAGNLKRANGRTLTLGLLVSSVANPFAGAVHRAIEQAAAERHTAVLAASLDDDADREEAIISAFLRRRVDGLILTTVSTSQSYLGSAQERGTSMVFVDRQPIGLAADSVISDNRNGAATATAHLLARGHRRIAYFGDRTLIQTANERRSGFLDELRRAGVSALDLPVVDDLSDEELALEAVARVLAGPNPPTAIFSSQNLVTIGAVKALRQSGLQHRVALVGFDDFPVADLLDPGITVIAQSPSAIGRLAADRIFARIDGDRSPFVNEVVPTTLIERGSGEIAPDGK